MNCQRNPAGRQLDGQHYIRSDQPLVAVVEILWGGTEMAGYSGYSVNR